MEASLWFLTENYKINKKKVSFFYYRKLYI